MNDTAETTTITAAAHPAEAEKAWGEIVYPLLYPVPFGKGATVNTITFTEPNGEMLEQIDDLGIKEDAPPNVRQTLALIRILSGVEKGVTDKMHKRDIKGAAEAMLPLLSVEIEDDE